MTEIQRDGSLCMWRSDGTTAVSLQLPPTEREMYRTVTFRREVGQETVRTSLRTFALSRQDGTDVYAQPEVSRGIRILLESEGERESGYRNPTGSEISKLSIAARRHFPDHPLTQELSDFMKIHIGI